MLKAPASHTLWVLGFAYLENALAIKLDSGQRMSEEALANDARRTAFLEANGYRVIRFSNIDVLTNIEGVILAIGAAVKGRGR